MILWGSCVLWLGYPLQNGVWPDISKHDNDGIITGVFWEGDSLEFDGIDDFVNCGSDSSIKPGAVTVEVWFNPYLLAADQILESIRLNSAVTEGYLLYQMSTNQIRFLAHISAGWDVVVTSDNPVTANKWCHAVATMESGSQKLYINGKVQASTGVQVGSISYDNANLRLGKDSDANPFKGLINLVRIYNKALTEAQIKESYNQAYRLV